MTSEIPRIRQTIPHTLAKSSKKSSIWLLNALYNSQIALKIIDLAVVSAEISKKKLIFVGTKLYQV